MKQLLKRDFIVICILTSIVFLLITLAFIFKSQSLKILKQTGFTQYVDVNYGYKISYPCNSNCIVKPPKVLDKNSHLRNVIDLPTMSTTTKLSLGVFSKDTVTEWNNFVFYDRHNPDPEYVAGDGQMFYYDLDSFKKATLLPVGSSTTVSFFQSTEGGSNVNVIKVGNTKGLELSNQSDYYRYPISRTFFVPLKESKWLQIVEWFYSYNQNDWTSSSTQPIFDSLIVE